MRVMEGVVEVGSVCECEGKHTGVVMLLGRYWSICVQLKKEIVGGGN